MDSREMILIPKAKYDQICRDEEQHFNKTHNTQNSIEGVHSKSNLSDLKGEITIADKMDSTRASVIHQNKTEDIKSKSSRSNEIGEMDRPIPSSTFHLNKSENVKSKPIRSDDLGETDRTAIKMTPETFETQIKRYRPSGKAKLVHSKRKKWLYLKI